METFPDSDPPFFGHKSVSWIVIPEDGDGKALNGLLVIFSFKINRIFGGVMGFTDRRGGKIVYISACLLNQNTRHPGIACKEAAFKGLVRC